MDIMKTISLARLLRQTRERLRLSPERMGGLLGVTGQTVRSWEAGRGPRPITETGARVRLEQLNRDA